MFYALQNIEVNNTKQCCLLKSKAFALGWLGKIYSIKEKSVGKLPSTLLYKFFNNVFSSFSARKRTERQQMETAFLKGVLILNTSIHSCISLLSLWAFDFYFFLMPSLFVVLKVQEIHS